MNGNTDIYSRLQRDHESVERIFEQISSSISVDVPERQHHFNELKKSLTQHSKAEDEVFYAALRQHSEAQGLMQESEKDHKRIETLLNELDHLEVSDPQWRTKLQSLKVVVEQHVHQEEGPVFTKAKALLTETQAREMGEQFDRAKDHTSMSDIKGTAAPYASGAAEQARDMGARVQHEAEHLTAETKDKARSLLQEQQHAVAEQIGGLAEALHQTTQHLQEHDHEEVAQYTGQAAQGLERFSKTLRERDINAIVGEVQDFARRQPAAFIGSAALLGFMAARFLKSSSESRHNDAERHSRAGEMPPPQAPVGPGAPVHPSVASAGAHSTSGSSARHDHENVMSRGGN